MCMGTCTCIHGLPIDLLDYQERESTSDKVALHSTCMAGFGLFTSAFTLLWDNLS